MLYLEYRRSYDGSAPDEILILRWSLGEVPLYMNHTFDCFSKYARAWVGAALESGSWKWADGDPASWAVFGPLNPTGWPFSYHHVAFEPSKKGMTNHAKTDKYPFICEIEGLGKLPLFLPRVEAIKHIL